MQKRKRGAQARDTGQDGSRLEGHPARASWEPVIDRMLGEAVRKQEWQNLKGRGQRLDLEPPPGTPPELILAHKIMADNDVVPAWIEDRKRLLARIRTWRSRVAAWQARREAGTVSAEDIQRQRRQWQQEVQALNRAIRDLNIMIPVLHMEVLKLDLDLELARAGSLPPD